MTTYKIQTYAEFENLLKLPHAIIVATMAGCHYCEKYMPLFRAEACLNDEIPTYECELKLFLNDYRFKSNKDCFLEYITSYPTTVFVKNGVKIMDICGAVDGWEIYRFLFECRKINGYTKHRVAVSRAEAEGLEEKYKKIVYSKSAQTPQNCFDSCLVVLEN